jgi:hypothetical protein
MGFMTKVSFVISYLNGKEKRKKKRLQKHGQNFLVAKKGENIALEIIDIFM